MKFLLSSLLFLYGTDLFSQQQAEHMPSFSTGARNPLSVPVFRYLELFLVYRFCTFMSIRRCICETFLYKLHKL